LSYIPQGKTYFPFILSEKPFFARDMTAATLMSVLHQLAYDMTAAALMSVLR
jgi:hypothetical protein